MTVTELHDGLGPVIAATLFDLAPLGYSQTEYVLDGTAAAYRRRGDHLEVVEHAEYATRLLVFEPTDAARFNGTVWVEWLNVSGGLDAAPDWNFTHTELMRDGAAWVGVSAQRIGVAGGDSVFGDMSSPGLVGTSPERYAGLNHPGDRFSYDIFTQAGQAARASLGSLVDARIERVLAIGESQSAFRLTTYVNEVDPLAQVFDGFFVHARGGPGAPLDDESPAISFDDPPVFFREDWKFDRSAPNVNDEREPEHLIVPTDVSNPNLEVRVYGDKAGMRAVLQPYNKDITYVMSLLTTSNWAVTLRDKDNDADLTGLSMWTWRTRESGFRLLRPLIKLANGTWLIGDKTAGLSNDFVQSEFLVGDVRWRTFDIQNLVEGREARWEENVDLSRVEEIGFTDLMRGAGHGSGGGSRIDWIQVTGKPVPRTASGTAAAGRQ